MQEREVYITFLECGDPNIIGEVLLYTDSTKEDGLDNQIAKFYVDYPYYGKEHNCLHNENCYENYEYEFSIIDTLFVDGHNYYFRLCSDYHDDKIEMFRYNKERLVKVNFCD